MLEIINNRRSCRAFSSQEVEKEKVDLLLRAAMQAPSAHNEQPWAFIVVTDKNLLCKYAEEVKSATMLKEAPLAIVVCALRDKIKTPLYQQDLAAATQNILLQATSLGLGSCWLGVAPRAERMEQVRALFNIPEEAEPFSTIALGYPKDNSIFNFRDNFNPEVIHYNRW